MVTAPAAIHVAMALGDDGSLPLETALTTLPHDFAAKVKRWAAEAGDTETLASLSAAKVAVDA